MPTWHSMVGNGRHAEHEQGPSPLLSNVNMHKRGGGAGIIAGFYGISLRGTYGNVLPFTDISCASGVLILRKYSEHDILCTIHLSNWLREDILVLRFIDTDLIILHQIAIAGNKDNIGEIFSWEGKRFTPCSHKTQHVHCDSDAQINWRIGFSYKKIWILP